MDNRRIALGSVEFSFDADVRFKSHRRSASRFIAKVSRELEDERYSRIGVGDYVIPLEVLFLDPQSMEPGSLKAVAAVVGIVAGASTIISNYSDMKREIPVLMQDIVDIAKKLSSEGEPGPPSRVLYPYQVAIIPRSTDDILRELSLDKRTASSRDKSQNLIQRD